MIRIHEETGFGLANFKGIVKALGEEISIVCNMETLLPRRLQHLIKQKNKQ